MKKILFYILLLTTSFISLSQEKQKDEGALQVGERKADTPFSLRQELSLRGNLTFIANNTLNRDGQGAGAGASNNAFNGNGRNDDNGNKYMDYIDIDDDLGISGHNDTFSSSSATLTLPNCSRVVYAGLYWAGIYPYENWDDEEDGINTRDDDFNEMKFRLPVGDYIDIVADKFDSTARELIYDDGLSDQKPYVCYKDVTSLLQGLTDPNGVYYGANIKATKGKDEYDSSLGSSAGWVLVVIYENETESQKKFFVFDGFSTIKRQDDGSAGVYDVPFSGFKTIPVGQVEANFMIAALEGDVNIDGDELQLEDTSGNFQSLTSGDENEIDNFFNSTITINNNYLGGRTPDSENTLGLDVDMFELNNSGNSLIGNDQEDGVLRFSSEGDTYWPFLTALSVEVIEPKVQLVKTIDDGTGVPNNLAGQDVTLGSYLWYDIAFQNVGTDDAVSTTIVDILPKNVDLLASDLIVPAGVTYVYEPPTAANDFRGRLTFTIPNNLVEEDDPAYSIRFRVQVAADCNLLRDACSNIIQNQAYANYTGDESGIVISNEESFESLDACNFGVVGTSNFLVDIDNCAFERTQALCGADVTLTAGDGFDTYSWTGPNGFTANTQSVTVTELGTYVVTRGTTSVCKEGTETITVISYDTAPNPLVDAADRILDTCPNNSFELAEIYLCGGTSSREIDLSSFSGTATTVRWFQLDESSCADETFTGCANVATDCTWNEVGNGELSRDFTDAGEFRLDVLYDGQCPISYYFNVYKATLNPVIDVEDIICGTPAEMTISNIPDGYQYSLSGVAGTATAGYFVDFQDSNIFTNITQAGDYNLTIRLDDAVAASCEYTFPLIAVQAVNIELELDPTDMQCAGEPATIDVSINNVPGPYTYVVYEGATTGGTVVGTQTAIVDNHFEFPVNNGGLYTVEVSTPECSATDTVLITEPSQLTLDAIAIKDITCLNGDNPGTIQLTAGGGTIDATSGIPYTFAVWSEPDTTNPSGYSDLYTSISEIQISDRLISGTNTYTYSVPNGSEGTYRFVVIDNNGCYTISEPVEIEVEPVLAFTNSDTDITCNGLTDGIINVAVDGDNLGYNIEYSINGGADWFTSGTFDNLPANTYTVNIRATKTTHQCDYVIPDIEITEPPVLAGGNAVATDLECNPAGGTVLGTITFTAPTDGTPGYSYYYKLTTDTDYTLANFDSGLTVIDLPAGTYDTRVEDANDCPRDLNQVTINGLPNAPVLNDTVVYNCNGTGNITVTATPAGTYTYTLDGDTTTSNNTGVFNNVDVGSHTIAVGYERNCVIERIVDVNAGNDFSGRVTATSDSECFGSDNGSITILANNVIGPSFEYSTDGGSTWSITADNPYRVVGLAAGTYNVFIREVDGGATCEVDLGNHDIAQPDELMLTASVTEQVTCNQATGTITASATGGVPPYTFSIDGGATWQSSPVFPGLPSRVADYIVMVRDDRNCNECGCTANLFENGGFELPAVSGSTFRQTNEDNIPGWDSTASDNLIEIWYNGFNGVTPHEGNAFAELNANTVSSLYQEYCTQPGDVISWSVAHRGRSGTDVATVKIGDDLATASVVETMSDGTSAWGVYSGTYTVPVGQSTTVIAFDAVSAAGGNTVGNFIDDVQITIARNNCIPVSVNISDPATLDFNLVPVTCYTGSNGTLTVNVTSGNGNYQFSSDNGTTWQTPDPATPDTYTFTNLTDGDYDITVTDGLGCDLTRTGTILPQVTATITTVNETCNTGQILITPSGGDGNFLFVVENTGTGTITNHTTSPIDVPAGTYNISVRDKNGVGDYCEYTETRTITRITDPTIDISAVQPDCSTDLGEINVTVGAGTPPYTVTVTGPGAPAPQGPSNNLNYSFTGLADGNYVISVSDANDCSPANATETISVPTALSGGSAAATDLACSTSGTILGTINFTAPTGGTLGSGYIYFYRLQGAPAPNPYIQIAGTSVSNLAAGTYETKVEDVNGCERPLDTVTIAPLPTEPTLTETVVYNCNGTGNITIAAVPGPTAPDTYTYILDGNAATSNTTGAFSNVGVGGHTVSVDYGSNCTVDINVTIEPDQAFNAVMTGNENPRCIGDSNGTVTVEASFPSGTVTEFEYSTDGGTTWINSGANPFAIPGFSAGATPIIQIRPVGVTTGCNISLASISLSDPDPITFNADVTKEITCNPATGATITLSNITGGNGATYTYELFNSSNVSQGTTTTTTFTNVPADSYTVIATDRLGCTSAAVPVTVNPRANVTFTPVAQCYDGSNGQIVVTVNTGNGDYSYSLDGGTNFTPVATNPFTISSLSPGPHNIRVQDGRGCFADATVTINPELFATATPTNASCTPTGEILVNPVGGSGTGYTFSAVPDGNSAGTFSGTNPITGLAANTYDVYVRDDAGCEYIIQNVVIGTTPPVEITGTPNEPTCNGDTGSVDGVITAGTGQAPYNIVITNAGGTFNDTISGFTGTNFSFNNLASDSYVITVTDDLSCSNTYSFTLANPPAIPMNIEPVLPSDCTTIVPANTGIDFNFGSLTLASYSPYTLQYTINGTDWFNMSTLTHSVSVAPHPTPGDNLYSVRGLTPGQVYYPAIRIMDGATVRCQLNNGIYVMPFQVSGIVVNVTPSGDCTTGYSVTVVAQNGVGPFEFGISTDDPINTNTWHAAIQAGPVDLDPFNPNSDFRRHIFNGIIPGLNYQFFVRDTDTGCIEMNDDPIDYSAIDSVFDVNITSSVSNQSCDGANNGQIEFTIEDTDGVLSGETINWTLYDGITDSALAITGSMTPGSYPHTFNVPATATLNPGLYFVVIETNSGGLCQWASGDVEILEGTPITGNLNVLNNITCSVDGSVRIENVSGGFGGYVYTVSTYETGTPANTVPNNLTGNLITIDDATLGGVTSVDVEVLVTDSNNCTTNLGPVTLTLSPSPVIDSAIPTSCDVNKSIAITVSSGTAPYRYSTDNGATFTAPTNSTTYTANGLAAGSYDIVVSDANGCSDTQAGVIIYDDIAFDLTPVQNLNCVPGEGVFNIEVTSGANLGTTGNFTYSVTPIATATPDNGSITGADVDQDITVTASGAYNVTVTDVTSGCSDTKSITIQDTVVPSFTHVAENSLCFGDNSGTITLTAVDNGILPLTYTISPVAGTITGNVISDLPPNTYSVTGTGTNGCTFTINNIVIGEYIQIVPSTPVVTEFECNVGTNLVNVATVTIPAGTVGGSGNYVRYVFTYDPADGSPDEIQDSSNASFSTTNTAGGAVNIVVYDDQGCSGNIATNIGAFEAITALNVTQATPITCNTGEEITVKTTPDINNITYRVTGPASYDQTIIEPVGTNSVNFTGLIEGTYTITATHPITNCVFETFYTVNEAPQFDLLITEVKDESCKDAENGKVVLEFNSTTPYGGQFDFELYDAATNTALDLSAAGLNIPNTGLAAPTSVYKLPAGTYYIIATLTSTGVPYCTAQTANFTIAEPDENLAITAVVDPQTSCSTSTDATITATATGGWGDYVYQLEDSAGTIVGTYDFATNGNNNVFTNIAPGDYRVIVRDKDGQGDLINAAEAISCRRSEFPVTVITRAPVNFTVNENDNSCDLSVAGGSIEVVNVVGGTGTYTYTLSNTGGVVETQVGSTATTYTFNNVPAGDYTVSVVDSNGCSNTAPIAITINPKLNFSLTETKKVDCSPSPDGQVELELTNWPSTSTYTYDVVGNVDGNVVTGVSITANPTTITIPAINGTPQTYTITVNDTGATPNCSVQKDIIIQPRIEPNFTASATTDDICFGSSTGEITVSVTDNGILPLDYTISPDPDGVGTVNSNTNVVFSNLPQGTYTITGVGTNGCSTQTDVTINQNNIIDLSAAIATTQFNCNAGTNTVNTAMITVDPAAIIGGSGNYVRVEFLQGATSLQNGSSFTYISTDEAGGTYTVNVYDDNGDCFGTDTVDINPFARLIDATVSVQKPIDCAQGEDINVTYNSSLPVTNVEFRLINDTSNAVLETRNTDGDFVTLLPTGTYRIEIENTDTNCVLTTYHTVEDEPEFELVIDNIQDACFGDTGNVDLSFSTATPYADDYTYEVFAVGNPTAVANGIGNGSAAITINNLPAGNYYVVINMTPNSPFCEVTSREFEIRQPAADLGVNYTLTYISCNVSDSGGAVLEGIGGWGNYQYQLVNNTTATTVQSFDPNTRITGLTAGNYTITVQDENDCTQTVDFELQDPTPLAAVITVNENDCEGQFTASIEVTNVTGGQTQDTTVRSYTYILILPNGTQVEQSSNVFNNLPAGIGYQVIVRDNKYNCEFRDTRDIVDPSVVQASANVTAAITCDRSQAEVTLSGQGGTGTTYMFSEDGVNFVLGNTFNVNAGQHTFYVRDENSCVDDVIVTVAAYEALTPTLNVINVVTCNNDENGTVSADVVGGLGNYEYQLLDENDVEIRTWQSSNLFGDLPVGFYKIRVRSTNAAGDVCEAETGIEEITQPTPLVIDEEHTDVTCFGGSNGTITIFASGANQALGYEYNINTEPADKFVTDNVFRNLPAGTYIITVKDKKGCPDTIEVTIEEPIEFSATLVSVDEQDCINDPTPVVTLDVQGGTMPYFVRINNGTEYGPYNTNTITIGAAEGIVGGQSYFFSVRDSGVGCDPAAPITFQTAEPVDLQLTVDFEYTCPSGNIIKAIVDDLYKNSMSYTLYDGAGSSVETNNTGEFVDVAAGNGYYVIATHTVTNCAEDSTSNPIDIIDIDPLVIDIDKSQKNKLIVNVTGGLEPYFYSFDGGETFSSDNEHLILQTRDYHIVVKDSRGDGCIVEEITEGVYVTIKIPNIFTPDGDGTNDYWYPEEVEDYHNIRVFIYDRYARKIQNFEGVQQGWDGLYDGKPLPSGDYWYTVYYNELSGEEKKVMGHFTLYR
ncbi:T9SS type B sorting domain-containing protein [Tenacibaculum pelagium]|nr:T9SS type B sorting domain-containing protein [Tenacibaculum pelagium]